MRARTTAGPKFKSPCTEKQRQQKWSARYRQIRFFSNALSSLSTSIVARAMGFYPRGRDSIFAQMRFEINAHTLYAVVHKFHPCFPCRAVWGYFADRVFFLQTTPGWFGDLFTRFRRPLFSLGLLFIKIMKLVAPRRPAALVLRRLLKRAGKGNFFKPLWENLFFTLQPRHAPPASRHPHERASSYIIYLAGNLLLQM